MKELIRVRVQYASKQQCCKTHKRPLPLPFFTVTRRLTTGMRSEKCVVRRFRHLANVIECTYTKLESTAYYTPWLYGAIWYSLLVLGYKPVQNVTVLNTVGNCNTMVSIIILYYNIMGPPSYMRSVVDRNVVMRRTTVIGFELFRSRYT